MGYIDQFVASVSFNTEKVIEFRKQNAWKTTLYILVFVIATGAITTFLRWDYSLELLIESGYFDVQTDDVRWANFITQYLQIFFDLIIHFILISVIAYAGSKGYKTIGDITYREAWTVTAYGISAPILARLLVRGMGLELPMMTFIYWGAIMIFSMICVKKVINLPK